MRKEKHYNILKRPLVTEKSSILAGEEGRHFLFEVEINSTKQDVKSAIENIFTVKVESINTVVVRGKKKRVGKILGKRKNWKKAYVLLKEGNTITFVEGV